MLALFVVLAFVAAVAGQGCDAGSYQWISNNITRCIICPAGCACSGGYAQCVGCNAGFYSPTRYASVCLACPAGTTTNAIYNAGCDPAYVNAPCENKNGPMGMIACQPTPPPSTTVFVAPNGLLDLPPQYTTDSPPYVPNKVSPYYNVYGQPMMQQSF